MPSQMRISNGTDSLYILKTRTLAMTNVTLVTSSLCCTMSKSFMYWHFVQETSLNVCCTYVH